MRFAFDFPFMKITCSSTWQLYFTCAIYTVCSLVNDGSLSFPRHRGRSPAPGFKKTYKSVLLGRRVNVRATLGTQRAIDRAGGFDRFIYYTPEENMKSTLAISLKRRMNDLVTR